MKSLMWLGRLVFCVNVGFCGEAGGFNEHTLEVSKRVPFAYKDFTVINEDKKARLTTTTTDTFIAPNTSAIISSRKHGASGWTKSTDTGKKFIAESPAVPKNTASSVTCAGAFTFPEGKPGDIVLRYRWRSELGSGDKDSWHIVVVNQYNDVENTSTFNARCLGNGQNLLNAYPGNKVLIKCGLNGDIASIAELPAELDRRKVPLGKVLTFDDLGHGDFLKIENNFVYAMLEARSVEDTSDHVTQSDITFEPKMKKPTMTFSDYANLFDKWLQNQARVSLLHCFTANVSKEMPKSIAEEVKSSLSHRNPVIGINDDITFREIRDGFYLLPMGDSKGF